MSQAPMTRVEPLGEVSQKMPVLRVEGLTVSYGARLVVQDVAFDLREGSTLGLVGESGSGKSVTARAILGLLGVGGRIDAGRIAFLDKELSTLPRQEMRGIRGGQIGMIFQDPRRALDPSFKIGTQIAEVVRLHSGVSRHEAWSRALELLREVHIPEPQKRAHEYPHQFSGGMCQRVMLAVALAGSPKVLIADEPTTALDVSIQSHILDLIRELQAERGLSVLFISHDLAVMAEMSDFIAVMYAGQIVEQADVSTIFRLPKHPYTQALLDSLPQVGASRFRQIPGVMPAPGNWPPGCRFGQRCGYRQDVCDGEAVALDTIERGHAVRCVRSADISLRGVQ